MTEQYYITFCVSPAFSELRSGGGLRPPAVALDTCKSLPCTVISQEGPEENSAYEQLLSHLEEIAEEGQFISLATSLSTLVHKRVAFGEPQVRG